MTDTAQIVGVAVIMLILSVLKYDCLKTSHKCNKSIKECVKKNEFDGTDEYMDLLKDIQKANFIWWLAVALLVGMVIW